MGRNNSPVLNLALGKVRVSESQECSPMSEPRQISFGIDSATLTIPLSKVSFPDRWLSSEVATVNLDTGEARDIREASNEYIKDRGVSTRYALKDAFVRGSKTPVRVLQITINAKQLGEKYLEGIRPSNISRVYDYIIDQGLVSMTLDDFLAGTVTDCDFKLDFHLPTLEDVYNNIQALADRTRPELKAKGKSVFNPYSEKGKNYGIDWYQRKLWKGVLPASKQNTRVYAKGLELTHNSSEFYANYMPARDEALTILRLETCGIKNAKTAERNYNITDTSLLNVLKLDQEQCKPMFTDPFSHFLNFDYKPPKVKEDHTFKEYNVATMMELLMEATDTNLDELWQMMERRYQNDVRQFKDKHEKSKQKRDFMNSYHRVFDKSDQGTDLKRKISEHILPFVNPAFGLS